jgi:hypothetical protein
MADARLSRNLPHAHLSALLSGGWSVSDTEHWVGKVREFSESQGIAKVQRFSWPSEIIVTIQRFCETAPSTCTLFMQKIAAKYGRLSSGCSTATA